MVELYPLTILSYLPVLIAHGFTQSSLKQNILFIVIDDLRPVLGCYGDPQAYTPHIDSLAHKSFLFTKAYAQQALCGPSRTSFLTSRSPHSLGQYDVHQYWRTSSGNFTSLPQFFKENGYHSASFGKVFHPGKCSNHSDDQPYSWSESPYHPPTEHYKNAAVCPSVNGRDPSCSIVCPVQVKTQPGHTLPDIETLNATRSFLRKHVNIKREKPFFLAVGFQKPHIPLKFPLKFLKHHPLGNIKLPTLHSRPPAIPTSTWNPWLDLRLRDDIHALNISFPWESIPDYYAKLIKQSYYASTSYVDDIIGKLLIDLDQLDLMWNTIIVLTSDHGWSLGEHGEWSKYSNYEVATKVPLIIHVPGLVGRHLSNLVVLLDIFPTLVDLSNGGISMPTCSGLRSELFCSEGRSLERLFKARNVSDWRDAVLSLYPRPGKFPSRQPNSDQPSLKDIKIMGYSIRTSRHRYTEWVAFDPVTNSPDWTTGYGSELYDHLIDTDENLNLSGRKPLKPLQISLQRKLHLMVQARKM